MHSASPRVMWITGFLLLWAVGLTAAPAQGSDDPGVEEFQLQLERAKAGRHANFAKAVSLLSNSFANDSENDELKTYLIRAQAADGAALFNSGDLEGALIRLRRALSLEPSSDAAHAVLGDLNASVQLEMLVRGGEFRSIIREFDNLRKEDAQRASTADTSLQEEARTACSEYVHADPERRWELLMDIQRLGEICVPHLLPWLGNQRDDNARSFAIAALNRMRGDSVLPIIRAMDSKNAFQRQNVAIVLGNIGDPRALAALQRAGEDNSENPTVKREAMNAVDTIIAGGASQYKASEFYWRKALDYYHERESLIRGFDNFWIVWNWDDSVMADGANGNGNVVGEDVPHYAYNERLSEQALQDLLALPIDDAGRKAALGLLVAVYINQYQEAKEVAMLAEDRGAADFDNVQQAADALEQAMVLAQAGGDDLLADVIRRAVSDGYAHTSIGAIDALVAVRGNVAALAPALKASDKRVRYRASTAALTLDPSGHRCPNIDVVIPNLVDALGEVGLRAVLVIEDQTDVRNRIINELGKLGINGYGAPSGLRGLARATQYPKADVILISDSLPGDDIDPRTVASRLGEDFRTAGTPIAILSDLDKVGLNDADFVATGLAARVISKDASSALLKEQMDFLIDNADEMDSGRQAANAAAQAAAEALASLDVSATAYPVGKAVPGLLSSVEQQGDAVRLPALAALRKFGDSSALRIVSACLADDSSSVEARAAAAEALGAIYARIGSIPSETVDMLAGLMSNREQPLELRRAAGTALGQAPLSPQQRIDVMSNRLLH